MPETEALWKEEAQSCRRQDVGGEVDEMRLLTFLRAPKRASPFPKPRDCTQLSCINSVAWVDGPTFGLSESGSVAVWWLGEEGDRC